MSTTLDINKKPDIKYQKLAEGLRAQIQSGELKPGDRLPSLAEMHEQHNLSRTTVERVHRLLEQDGLVVREQGRGTFVARRKRNSGFIGVSGYCFERKLRVSYWSQVVEGMQECATQHGLGLVLLDHQTFSGWDKVDGMIIADPMDTIAEAIKKVPCDIPRVSILSEGCGHASVGSNDYQGGQLATEHLLDLGHRRIACLMDKEIFPSTYRYAGYRDALKRAGVEFDPRWVRDYSVPGRRTPDFTGRGKEIMRQWLSEDWQELGCTAMVLQNDLVAAGVMEVLREVGISVPDQLSIVGYDSLELCDFMLPRLTSVHVPLREVGWTAADVLLREIETNRGTQTTTLLPVQLDRRESTAPPKQ